MIVPADGELREMIERGLGPGTFATRGLNPWEDYTETKSGLLVPGHVVQKPEWPTGVDLFSGAGGFSLGLMRAGFRIAGCIDNDPVCMLTYLVNLGSPRTKIYFVEPEDEARWERLIKRQLKEEKRAAANNKNEEAQHFYDWDVENLEKRNWGFQHRHYSEVPESQAVEVAVLGDARKITGEHFLELLGMEMGEIDCICGGPPCQGFTTVGKRQVMDPRNSLVFEWARLVVEMKPKTCIMENVPGIVSMVTPEGLPILDVLAKILQDGGMGPADALRKMLIQTSGAGAVISSSGTPAKPGAPKKLKKEQVRKQQVKEVQPSLL